MIKIARKPQWRAIQMLGLTALSTSALMVHAAPGSPGQVGARKVIFQEDFDNPAMIAVQADQASMVTDYVSASKSANGNFMRYQAAGHYTLGDKNTIDGLLPFWSIAQFCNGIVVNWDKAIYPTADLSTLPGSVYPPADTATSADVGGAPHYCSANGAGPASSAWDALRLLSYALGKTSDVQGTATPAQLTANHAVTAYTQLPNNRRFPPAPSVQKLTQLETKEPIGLPGNGRFVTFSVATAALNCSTAYRTPQLFFELDTVNDSGQVTSTVALNDQAIDPCNDPQKVAFANKDFPAGSPAIPNNSTIYAAQVPGNKPFKVLGNKIHMRLLNGESRGYGNDAAIDNLQVLDVTPQLDKQFEQSTVGSNQPAYITFTVTNTLDKLNLQGWSFSDVLPAGFEFVSAAGADATACGGTTNVAFPDNKTMNVTAGELTAGQAFCTVKVGVKVSAETIVPPGGLVFRNGAQTGPGEGLVTTSFLDEPDAPSVIFTPTVDMQAASPPAAITVSSGQAVTVSSACTNNGRDTAENPTCVVDGIPPGAIISNQSCTPNNGAPLPAGGSISCTVTFIPQTAGAVIVRTTAGTSTAGDDPANNVASTPVTVNAQADMGASAPLTVPGESGKPVSVTSTCTNLGLDAAVNATCTLGTIPSDVTNVTTSCIPTAGTTLAVGAAPMVCTTTFTPAKSGTINLMTVAKSDTPDSNLANDTAPTTVTVTGVSDMEATATPAVTVESGKPVTVTSTCTNKGPDAAVNATCTLGTIPTDATDVSTTCSPTAGTTLAAGAAPMVCTTTFTPAKSGTINLTTTAKSDTKDNNPANDTAPTVVTVNQAQADMQSSSPKTVNGTVNQPVSVTSTCTNAGPDAAVAASCTVSGAPAGATTVCTPTTPVTSLAKGGIISCTTTFTPTTTSSITLVTTAATTSTDPDASNDTSSAQVTFGSTAASPTPVPVNSVLMLSLLSLLMGAPLARRAYKRKSNG